MDVYWAAGMDNLMGGLDMLFDASDPSANPQFPCVLVCTFSLVFNSVQAFQYTSAQVDVWYLTRLAGMSCYSFYIHTTYIIQYVEKARLRLVLWCPCSTNDSLDKDRHVTQANTLRILPTYVFLVDVIWKGTSLVRA